jgi:hypothetical protein
MQLVPLRRGTTFTASRQSVVAAFTGRVRAEAFARVLRAWRCYAERRVLLVAIVRACRVRRWGCTS